MGVIDEIKSVVEVIKKIDNIELYRQILDLQSEIMKLVEENNELKTKIKELESKFILKESFVLGLNSYWIKKGDEYDGPFCTRCWDSDKKLIRIISQSGRDRFEAMHRCPNCNSQMNAEPPRGEEE